MSEVSLSINLESYLEVIGDLVFEHGHAHVKEVARILNVKAPSVTSAIRSLVKKDLIYYKAYDPITLTASGRDLFFKLENKHAVIKDFLEMVLAMKPYTADSFACKLEHVMDDRVVKRVKCLNVFLNSNPDLSGLLLVGLKRFMDKNMKPDGK